ncbi:ATP-binding cassette domain-containing protein [Chloroflexia bacterium SDU3-3]|nr:ATP-binding cassette domain-containing protein [Chloroflexia bacterium SDU3-3]
MIKLEQAAFSYNAGQRDAIHAVRPLDLAIAPGELVAVIGANGSGKSTLARMLCALALPTAGRITVDGVELAPQHAWEVRRRVGMVFQRPDDQLIANTVVDDVAFGPENLGLPPAEIERRVQGALAALGLEQLADMQISQLSGGEKQRVAIAGVLAMEPRYLILDEPTTMIPQQQARDLIGLAHGLRERLGVAVIHITHFMPEIITFDRVVVLHQGQVAMQGTPREVFAQRGRLAALGLAVPMAAALAERLRRRGVALPEVVLTPAELRAHMAPLAKPAATPPAPINPNERTSPQASAPLIEVRDLHFSYMAGTPLERPALRGASCAIAPGETVAILGGTQAGKSTLVEFFNALRTPGPGHVFYQGQDVAAPGFDRERLRRAVAVVFQQPETQLLEEIVGMDISYAPRQKKLPPAQSRALVQRAMEQAGLDYEAFRLRYVHALSGGQKRRVAIAGALAAEPQALVLDEPTAGLDPQGRDELAALVGGLRGDDRMAVVVVGHSFDALASRADRVLVMAEGRVVMEGAPRALLRRADELLAHGVELDEAASIALELRAVFPALSTDVLDLDELERAIMEVL